MTATKIGAALFLALGLFSTAAAADDTAPVKKDGVYYFKDIVIPGRPQRPAVAVDVAKVVPRAPLPDLKKPLVDRIAQAVDKDPF